MGPQAVGQLRNLNSQEPVLCSVTIGVPHFERCALWVQLLYYPFNGRDTPADFEEYNSEEEYQMMRQTASLRPEMGDPVILICQPYKIPLTELMLPHKISPVEYFLSMAEFTCYSGVHRNIHTKEVVLKLQQLSSMESLSPFLSGLKSLSLPSPSIKFAQMFFV